MVDGPWIDISAGPESGLECGVREKGSALRICRPMALSRASLLRVAQVLLQIAPKSRIGRRWMSILIIPSYFLAFLLGVAAPVWQPVSFFAVSLLVMIAVTLVYSIAQQKFCNATERPTTAFVTAAVAIQLSALAIVGFVLSVRR